MAKSTTLSRREQVVYLLGSGLTPEDIATQYGMQLDVLELLAAEEADQVLNLQLETNSSTLGSKHLQATIRFKALAEIANKLNSGMVYKVTDLLAIAKTMGVGEPAPIATTTTYNHINTILLEAPSHIRNKLLTLEVNEANQISTIGGVSMVTMTGKDLESKITKLTKSPAISTPIGAYAEADSTAEFI